MAVLKNISGWLFSSLGYLLYTLGVLAVLLWFLFPADTVKSWLQARLNTLTPSLQWQISGLRPTLPPGIAAGGISLADKHGDRSLYLEVAELTLSPDYSGLAAFDRTLPLAFQARLLDGTVEGRIVLADDLRRVEGEGEAQGLELGALAALWRKIGRACKGSLSGPFTYRGPWGSPLEGDLHAEPVVSRGSIGLLQPLFGLEVFEFSRLAAVVNLADREMLLQEGEADSRMLAASYSGTVDLADPLLLSKVQVEGSFEPRPELLGRLENETTVRLIKSQLQDDRLQFSISGTLLEPGIVFQGKSGVIDGIIQGGAEPR